MSNNILDQDLTSVKDRVGDLSVQAAADSFLPLSLSLCHESSGDMLSGKETLLV